MRGKTPLVIMELVIMLLVFALAAAMCLGAFVLADSISSESELRDEAAARAQNCAELLRHSGGDFEWTAEKLGGECDGSALTAEYPELSLCAEMSESGHELLGKAHISVSDEAGQEIFSLDCAWQKGGESDG